VSLGSTVPVSLQVDNGEFQIKNLDMNHRGALTALTKRPGVTWPGYEPENISEVAEDYRYLTPEVFEDKYKGTMFEVIKYFQNDVILTEEIQVNGQDIPPIPDQFQHFTAIRNVRLRPGDTLTYNLLLENTVLSSITQT
jgi:hypothetical protein